MEQNIAAGKALGREEGAEFLRSLLDKGLRISTTDSRMFRGTFKCTDPDSNIVLAQTYEYRQPSLHKLAEEAATTVTTNQSDIPSELINTKVKMDMTSRYLGLVVVPGQHIVKIELEQFASQMRV
ncbi:hypothetical protein VTK73DRAFT_7159 [Phialemonium thermophilum]|uniref:Sm domain-containing protein n=1 Tax=Phialemonium thermophilum TaxID=223376 RepID=A0ABR3XUP0_9PEZI